VRVLHVMTEGSVAGVELQASELMTTLALEAEGAIQDSLLGVVPARAAVLAGELLDCEPTVRLEAAPHDFEVTLSPAVPWGGVTTAADLSVRVTRAQ